MSTLHSAKGRGGSVCIWITLYVNMTDWHVCKWLCSDKSPSVWTIFLKYISFYVLEKRTWEWLFFYLFTYSVYFYFKTKKKHYSHLLSWNQFLIFFYILILKWFDDSSSCSKGAMHKILRLIPRWSNIDTLGWQVGPATDPKQQYLTIWDSTIDTAPLNLPID